ncbi:ribonuclease III [candidate division KSB1 bacterium]|nr:ribonuclease III [candidate division KSB1 bacterium]
MSYFYRFIRKIFPKFRKGHRNFGESENDRAKRFARHIGVQFHDMALLIRALKHRSYLSVSNEERLSSNERLELLGDAVLGLVVTEYLYSRYPQHEEGQLTTIKSLVVSREILASAARKLRLGEFILLNEAEEKAGGRQRHSILADAFEAILGAMYLDRGLITAKKFIRKVLLKDLKKILSEEKNKNFKSILLEYSQSRSLGLPYYVVKDEEGPDHNKLFTVEVHVKNETLGCGKGTSKKIAEQYAARDALKRLFVIQ